ncbi:MAG: hypothetical protein J1F04_07160 [Oscillospiraceae bacterium]|nr:hypothetical protein [Oscillospiraceae bacterium]
MSFKDDYKSAFGSVSPDTDKIIAEVHNKLNENAPVMIRAERKKKPVWAIVGSVAGAAACIAVAAFVAVRIAPNFLRDNLITNGVSPENYYDIQADANAAGTAGAAEGYGGANVNDADTDAKFSGGNPNMIASESLEDGNESAAVPETPDNGGSDSRVFIKVNTDDISAAREIIINGSYYVSSGETVSFDDISGDIMRISDIDGRWFNIVFDDNRAYVSDEDWWKKGQMICFYRE